MAMFSPQGRCRFQGVSVPRRHAPVRWFRGTNSFLRLEETMNWEAPDFEEISLCCEINSYASAQL
jgi:coenzyme PQQ precursor peptide PqqA